LVESRLGAALPLLASTAARNMDRRVVAQQQLPAKVVKITVFSQTSAAVRRFDKLSDSQVGVDCSLLRRVDWSSRFARSS
jgi:hypothetical protein